MKKINYHPPIDTTEMLYLSGTIDNRISYILNCIFLICTNNIPDVIYWKYCAKDNFLKSIEYNCVRINIYHSEYGDHDNIENLFKDIDLNIYLPCDDDIFNIFKEGIPLNWLYQPFETDMWHWRQEYLEDIYKNEKDRPSMLSLKEVSQYLGFPQLTEKTICNHCLEI